MPELRGKYDMSGDTYLDGELMTLVATALCAEMNRVSGTGSFHDCERLAETAIKTISTYQATGRSGAGAVEKTRGALL